MIPVTYYADSDMAKRVGVALSLVVLLTLGGPVRADEPPVTMRQAQPDGENPPAPASEGQDSSPFSKESASDAPDDSERLMSLRCPGGARANWLYWGCVGRPFESFTETLTKDWGGFRSFLAGFGIVPFASYTAQLVGNPYGGRDQGFTYAGQLNGLIAVDLDRLLGLPGLSFTVGASWSTGTSLSAQDIGNVFTVQSAFAGTGVVSLQQMYLQQRLFDGSLSIAAGRLAPGNTFATLPVFNNYLNGGISPIPASLTINDPIFAQSPPGVEWGVQLVYDPIVPLQMSLGVYNTNPFAANGADHGVDFSFQQGNTGVLTVVQLNYRLNHAKTDTGLPGEYAIGGFYDSNAFNSLNPPPGSVSGNYAVYAMFQQVVYRDKSIGSTRGMTIWGEVALAPRQSASPIHYLVAGGLSYRGLLSSRESDIASLGVISGTFSRHVPDTSAETVLEANYQALLPHGMSITPDVQYVIKPSGSSGIKNALVIGLQLAVTF
jgi:porin